MSLEELESIEITSVEQGRSLAEDIRVAQVNIHQQMVGQYDKQKWQELCNRHYDLRKLRQRILHTIGQMVIDKRRAT